MIFELVNFWSLLLCTCWLLLFKPMYWCAVPDASIHRLSQHQSAGPQLARSKCTYDDWEGSLREASWSPSPLILRRWGGGAKLGRGTHFFIFVTLWSFFIFLKSLGSFVLNILVYIRILSKQLFRFILFHLATFSVQAARLAFCWEPVMNILIYIRVWWKDANSEHFFSFCWVCFTFFICVTFPLFHFFHFCHFLKKWHFLIKTETFVISHHLHRKVIRAMGQSGSFPLIQVKSLCFRSLKAFKACWCKKWTFRSFWTVLIISDKSEQKWTVLNKSWSFRATWFLSQVMTCLSQFARTWSILSLRIFALWT